MIWFTCKQCGKAHGRAETSIGTLVFCECGEGNLVPWESTASEPPRPAEPAPAPEIAAPKLEPVTFDPPAGKLEAQTYELLAPTGLRRRPRRGRYKPDPNFCLTHPTTPSKQSCSDCQERFCEECVVTFQSELLCGPCKNFRVRTLDAPPRLSVTALVSLVLALASGPLVLCLLPLGRSSGSPYLSLAALLPQLVALALGILALRETGQSPRVAGWSLGLTGLLTASVASVLTVLLTVFGPRLGV